MTPENLRKSKQAFNKDDLSFLVACLLGDGCLGKSGRLILRHGLNQEDYCEWKAKRLSEIIHQPVLALRSKQTSQIQIQRKFFKELRYKVYNENSKKLIDVMLDYITNPLEALAIWLCDDGNVSPSMNTKNGKCYSACFKVFTFTDLHESTKIRDWFGNTLSIEPKLVFLDRSKSNRKSAYILKFSAQDSYKIYKMIKVFIPDVPSMKYKFRYIENIIFPRDRDKVDT